MGQIKTRKGTKSVSTGARAAYKRVLLKLSGEALQGEGLAINPNVVLAIGKQLADIHALGIEIGIVIGGGNIFRGMKAAARGMDRSTADYMGMLATVINALALQDGLEKSNVPTRVLTAIQMQSVAEPYIRRRAMRHMEKGRVVIFAAGTGNPYFSTDTTAALRAVEIGADVLLKATKVDGIYDADPLEKPRAKFFPEMAYLKVLQKNLKVMDSTAVTLCRDNELPIIVFNLAKPQNIRRVIMGEKIGTLVH